MNFYISCRCDDSENSGSFVKNDKLKRERERKKKLFAFRFLDLRVYRVTVCLEEITCVQLRKVIQNVCVQVDDLGLVFISWKMMYIDNVNISNCYSAISSFVHEKTCFRIDLKCTCIYV